MAFFNSRKTKYIAYIDSVLRLFYRTPATESSTYIKKENMQRIVIIAFLLIGDSIMYLPALRVIRKNYPSARITLVGGKLVKEIFKNQNVFDDFIETECIWVKKTKNIFAIIKFFRSLKTLNKNSYDLAIDFRGDWRNIFYMSFITADRKISYNYTGGQYMLSDSISPNSEIFHYTDSYLYLLSKIGCIFDAEDYYPKFILSDEQRNVVSTLIDKNKLSERFIIGIHPGASLPIKQLDLNIYIETIEIVNKEQSGAHFLIFEGPNESHITASLCSRLSPSIKYTLISSPIDEYISYISGCDILICNDSGSSHIAAALGIPSVIIYTNVDFKYVKPYSKNTVKIISHTLPCKPCFQNICPLNTEECKTLISSKEISDATIDLINIISKK